jgi:hypothetical protein
MTSASEQLCLSCGFCCDGTLFSSAPLRPTDPGSHPLRIVTRDDGSRSLQQPCGALVDLHCTIYTERPAVCRSYKCDLLVALESDEVSLNEAIEIVARVKRLASSPDERAKLDALLVHSFRGRRGG